MDDWNIEGVVVEKSDDLLRKVNSPCQGKVDNRIIVNLEEHNETLPNDNLIEDGKDEVSGEENNKVDGDQKELGNELAEHNGKNKEGVYICDKCSHVFSSLFWFSKHKEKCALVYQCDMCPKILKNDKCLKEHRLKRHGNLFECETCEECFNTVTKLKNHVKSVHEAQKECPQCKIICKNIRTLKVHLKKNCKRINKDPKNENVSDKKENNTEENIEAHNNSFQLDTNLGQKEDDDNLVEHIVVQKNKRKETKYTVSKLQCNDCSKTFGTTNGLRRHILTHQKFQEVNPSSESTSETISISIDDNGDASVQIVQLNAGQNYDDVEIEYIE